MFNKIELKLQPEHDGLLPYSDGYLMYSALLNEIESLDESASETLHDEEIGLNVSMLDGPFKSPDDVDGRNKVFSDATYDVSVCVYGEDMPFQQLVQRLIEPELRFQIGDIPFTVQHFDVKRESVEDVATVDSVDEFEMVFETGTNIEYDGNSEVFPHRAFVFNSIQTRWNKLVDERYQTNLSISDIRSDCYTIPIETDDYKVRVATNSMKHVFTGRCKYRESPESDKWKQLLILAKASQYIAVGSHVARGLGNTRIRFD
jgi:CRISPR-associated endoribonuclease Cas6